MEVGRNRYGKTGERDLKQAGMYHGERAFYRGMDKWMASSTIWRWIYLRPAILCQPLGVGDDEKHSKEEPAQYGPAPFHPPGSIAPIAVSSIYAAFIDEAGWDG